MQDPDYQALKEQAKKVWSLGDYGAVARAFQDAAERLVEACEIGVGDRVLDVAAGNGNVALAAARKGARVLATDLTPAQVERGRARSEAEGLYVEWEEADAEALHLDDALFDRVTSAFGAMFAPRPELVTEELFRVVRPGGLVGMANWAMDGYVGELLEIMGRHLPMPEGLPSPVEWGDEDIVRKRFAGKAAHIEVARHGVRWEFESLEDKRAFEVANFGPVIHAKASMAPEHFEAMIKDCESLVMEHNRADGGRIHFEADYLIVMARRP